jgi:CheY-like chemotaxis protein
VPNLKNILVAEDNEDDVFLLRQALRKVPEAAALHVVSHGAEVVAWLEGNEPFANRKQCPVPDVLLLDLNMPKMNGFEVLTWIRSRAEWSRLMVHVLTASSRASDVQQVYDLHANSYVLKPTRLDELIAFMIALHDWHKFVCLPSAARPETPVPPSASYRPLVTAGAT